MPGKRRGSASRPGGAASQRSGASLQHVAGQCACRPWSGVASRAGASRGCISSSTELHAGVSAGGVAAANSRRRALHSRVEAGRRRDCRRPLSPDGPRPVALLAMRHPRASAAAASPALRAIWRSTSRCAAVSGRGPPSSLSSRGSRPGSRPGRCPATPGPSEAASPRTAMWSGRLPIPSGARSPEAHSSAAALPAWEVCRRRSMQ